MLVLKLEQNLFQELGRLPSVNERTEGDSVFRTMDVDFYTIHQYMLSTSFVKNAHRLDREVWVWTVNEDNNIRQVLKFRVDGIITKYPERVKEVMAE